MSLRFDRWATLKVFQPLGKCLPKNQSRIPILMYHAVSADDESRVHPYYRTNTSPAVFARQMRELHEYGYSTISLSEAAAELENNAVPARKAVVITFDDGHRDFYREAVPVLEENGFIASMFLPTAHIQETTAKFKGRECLTWSEIRALQSRGMHFGSHTVSHPQLHDLDEMEMHRELVESKNTIEQKLGTAIESFAYPYAFPEADKKFVIKLRDGLLEAGYRNGVCTMIGSAGPSNDPLFLKRLPVNSCDDSELFAAKLSGAYDWLARPQYILKRFKAGSIRPNTKGFKASLSNI